MTHPLEQLAMKCEGANGPDRDLDVAIDVAVRGGPGANFPAWVYTNFPTWRARAGGRVEVVHKDGTGGVHWTPRPYTASLDAALTLVPEAHWLDIKTGTQKHAPNFQWPVVAVGRQSGDVALWRGQATTPALALCAAALRSRAALSKDQPL